MNLAKYFVSATAVFLLATTTSAADAESTIKSDNVTTQFRLTKLVYERAHRTTFWIEMESARKGLHVRGVCDLRKDGVGVGRFPLEQVGARQNTDATCFRISCLHDDFVEDTVVHVLVRDEATGKSIYGTKIRLKDAESVRKGIESLKTLPDTDEAPAAGNA
ncbi:hypothetical protein KOR42_48420 [Thalassoglobus neptunius]|uniref:Uncharacterized protein n=1 Tax=Thalassoglobus neptunius TaxID=1938619 RepID=A0A5C5VUV4_9PLAN|nr:hypothetical protein [Thalassoglobus neptunius]TWT41302.1 hypothetical protein KOR42_48420 [Thalassoglobus neptunius]